MTACRPPSRQSAIALAVIATLAVLLPAVTARAAAKALGPPEQLDVGQGTPAFYYAPIERGQKPVVVYLHGRGGNPALDCRKWAVVAREIGWLLCPSGQEDRGGGGRGWGNDWPGSKINVDRSLAALREKFGRRVQLRGNILVGFSEGAFVAMNVGVREPEVYNRWLILAANTSYWGGEGEAALKQGRKRIKRVYLLTGAQDEVVGSTRRVFDLLDEAHVHVLLKTPSDLGHEVPEPRMRELYRRPLRWLAAAR